MSNHLDSMRIVTYQKEYGKGLLKNMIDTSLAQASAECADYDCFKKIPFTYERAMRFKMNSYCELPDKAEMVKSMARLIERFKKCDSYKLIKEG